MQRINLIDNPRFEALKDQEKNTMLKDMPLNCLHITDMWKEDGQWPPLKLPSAFVYFVTNLNFDNEYIGIHFYFSVSGIIYDFEQWYNDEDEEVEKFAKVYEMITHKEPPEITEGDIENIYNWAMNLQHKVCLMAEDH